MAEHEHDARPRRREQPQHVAGAGIHCARALGGLAARCRVLTHHRARGLRVHRGEQVAHHLERRPLLQWPRRGKPLLLRHPREALLGGKVARAVGCAAVRLQPVAHQCPRMPGGPGQPFPLQPDGRLVLVLLSLQPVLRVLRVVAHAPKVLGDAVIALSGGERLFEPPAQLAQRVPVQLGLSAPLLRAPTLHLDGAELGREGSGDELVAVPKRGDGLAPVGVLAVELIAVERHDEADIERRESWRSVAEHRLADGVHEIEQRKAHAEVDARGGRAVDELRRAKSEAVVRVDVKAQQPARPGRRSGCDEG
mmetsp:Transcript_26622/g.87388  ORF Transcript_26622/g.87388 Transcript_26622/m.87388 type:complete len:309 (+) Transcript_26622:486-1412(+)